MINGAGDVNNMSDQRLVEIESKLAYQEQAIKDLNEVVLEQQKQIDKLEETCKYLMDRRSEAPETSGLNIIDEKPPHY